ncbi:acyl-CoA carboxylase epsilon subunit, partial [Streptomyces hydrogenans]
MRGAASPEELAAVTAVLLAVTRNRPADAEGT